MTEALSIFFFFVFFFGHSLQAGGQEGEVEEEGREGGEEKEGGAEVKTLRGLTFLAQVAFILRPCAITDAVDAPASVLARPATRTRPRFAYAV